MNYCEIKNIDEIHQIEREMLKTFILFCEKYNLKYFLAYGSALGAYRHSGFIPWDDDIDICMIREEYDNLIRLIEKGIMLEEPYEIKIPGSKKYPYSFIKIINKETILLEPELDPKYTSGIWIDIFPIDHISNNSKMNKEAIKKINFYNNRLHNGTLNIKKYKRFKKKINILISKIFLKLFSIEKTSQRADREARNYNQKCITSKLYSEIVWYQDEKEILNIDDLIPRTIGQFENLKVFLPKNIAKYLTIKYGKNFMIPPKQNKQKTHGFIAYKEVKK